MKTLKYFMFEQKVEQTTEKTVVVESIPLVAVDGINESFLDEGDTQNHSSPMDPPAVLIMRRKSIRLFPNNQRVALYYVDKINKYVTVPYMAMQWSDSMPEGFEIIDDVIEESVDAMTQLQNIKDTHQHGTIKHLDGSKSKVDVQTAHAILTIHKNLNPENKEKYANLVAKSKQHMQKASDFAWKHLK